MKRNVWHWQPRLQEIVILFTQELRYLFSPAKFFYDEKGIHMEYKANIRSNSSRNLENEENIWQVKEIF